MKGSLDRTKVVLRHLPPTISKASLLDQIDGSFAGRYNWVSFRPVKSSQKNLAYSRAYIDFKRPEDVIEFAEFFDGHVFVNEKGTQFKVIVEYAPSQRVPKQWSKKDGREGTIYTDSEYLEFLELLAKPAENLPSAEIQLERREAERSGAVIVTPLMDFVRQKRAAKGGSRRSLSNGKVSRRAGAISNGNPSSAASKRGYGKKRASTMMYVKRDSTKSATVKDKSTLILLPKQSGQHLSDRTTTMASSDGNQAFEDESGVARSNDTGKKKILLLKGKERDIITKHSIVSSAKTTLASSALNQNQQREGSGRMIRSILSNKDLCQNQSARPHSEQQIQTSSLEKEKRPPRPLHVQLILKGTNGGLDDRVGGNDLHAYSERQEKRGRHRDRPDRGVWAYRSNGGDESLSSSASSQLDYLEGSHAEMKHNTPYARSGEIKTIGSGRASHSSENGFSKPLGRHGPTNGMKDIDGYSVSNDGKYSRRSSPSAYGSHEKQVWVQKASSGT